MLQFRVLTTQSVELTADEQCLFISLNINTSTRSFVISSQFPRMTGLLGRVRVSADIIILLFV